MSGNLQSPGMPGPGRTILDTCIQVHIPMCTHTYHTHTYHTHTYTDHTKKASLLSRKSETTGHIHLKHIIVWSINTFTKLRVTTSVPVWNILISPTKISLSIGGHFCGGHQSTSFSLQMHWLGTFLGMESHTP